MAQPPGQMPEDAGRDGLRASQADREQVIGTLKAAYVQGRLDKDELDLRVGRAFASRTYADLATLTADLPAGLTAAKLARYKLGRITADDADGYHRVQCPAAMGKVRCPLRPASMLLDRGRPEILQPPEHPPACCAQQTLTVPPDVLAKTAQKHDYPSAAWRRSCSRRTGAERGFATTKDPASNEIARGWCR